MYDDVDSLTPRDLRAFLPSGTGHMLITSRNPHWGGTAQVVNVNIFTVEEAVNFLQVRSKQVRAYSHAQERTKVRTTNEALARELGYLPLALEHAAAYMETRDKSAADYLALYRERRQALWARADAPDTYHATITTTWDIGFNHARHTPGAAALLNLCCFLAPDDIPLALLQAQTNTLPEELAAVVTDELALDDALTALTRFSLLTKQAGTLAIHRLVQTVARDQMAEEQAKEWAEAGVTLLSNAYNYNPHDMGTWPACGQLLPHLIITTNLADNWEVETAHAAYLNNETGFYLYAQGQYEEARPFFQRALDIREQALSPDHPDTANSLNNLGALLKAMGQLAEARPFFQRALDIHEQALGSDHPHTQIMRDNLDSLNSQW